MKLSKRVSHKKSKMFFKWASGMRLATVDENTYRIYSEPTTCRGFMQDELFMTKFPESRVRKVPEDFTLNPDHTIVFHIGQNKDRTVTKGLKKLNDIEKKYNLKETTVEKVEEGYLFFGDKAWQTCLWKQSIYTFYLKLIFNPQSNQDYQEILKKYEEPFLSKVKDFNEEIFQGHTYIDSHVRSGFVTISGCEVEYSNKPMQKLLLGDKYDPEFSKSMGRDDEEEEDWDEKQEEEIPFIPILYHEPL